MELWVSQLKLMLPYMGDYTKYCNPDVIWACSCWKWGKLGHILASEDNGEGVCCSPGMMLHLITPREGWEKRNPCKHKHHLPWPEFIRFFKNIKEPVLKCTHSCVYIWKTVIHIWLPVTKIGLSVAQTHTHPYTHSATAWQHTPKPWVM